MRKSFISLFSGVGGLDRGLADAGWVCEYASDIEPSAVETLKLNANGHVAAGVADVSILRGSDILEHAGARRGEIPLLVGGPPCQSWSSAGHQRGWEDPRGRLFEDFVRLADETGVQYVLFENVRGLLTARGPDGQPGSALAHIRQQLLARGFHTTVTLLNAADFGVAQRRVRLFVLAHRESAVAFRPLATHAKDAAGGLLPWVSLGECLREIAPPKVTEIVKPSAKLSVQLEGIPDGSGVRSEGKAERTRPGGHWGYKQGAFIADQTLPARTVTANSQQDWIRDRRHGLRKLTTRECAAIQSFPANWQWPVGLSNADLYRLIGNAVPPRLARAVGLALEQALAAGNAKAPEAMAETELLPLPPRLAAAVAYTLREETSNGASRRAAPNRRAVRLRRKEPPQATSIW